jgi:hypothetical protein
MLSFAVWTRAGAFDRQLPVPFSHFLPRGVWVPEAVGVIAPSEDDVDPATELFEGVCSKTSLALGVVVAVVGVLASAGMSGPAQLPSAGAWGLGFDFLRGFIRAGRVKELSRRNGL